MKRFVFALVVAALAAAFGPHGTSALALAKSQPVQQETVSALPR